MRLAIVRCVSDFHAGTLSTVNDKIPLVTYLASVTSSALHRDQRGATLLDRLPPCEASSSGQNGWMMRW